MDMTWYVENHNENEGIKIKNIFQRIITYILLLIVFSEN